MSAKRQFGNKQFGYMGKVPTQQFANLPRKYNPIRKWVIKEYLAQKM